MFDLGAAVALANTAMFAPYKVATWKDIGDDFKEPTGLWVNDYGGYMGIGYDSAKVPAPASVADLLKPAYKGKVALNGNPTEAGAAFAGVQMASVANGGTVGDLTKGVDFFSELNKAGNFLPVDPTPATIESGQTPVVIDWDYLNAAQTDKLPTWKVLVPKEAIVAGYYSQAINADAPHPAAARLWQEFLYSDIGQNLWLVGGARPVRFEAMKTAGTLDAGAAARCPRRRCPDRADPGRRRGRQDLPRRELGQRRWLTPREGGHSAGAARRVPSWASSPSSPTRRSSC